MKTSKSLSFGDLSFRWAESCGPSIGFVVSKKYGNAIQRNLFKRRCRDAFVQLYQEESFPVVGVLVRPKTINMNYKKISSAFKALSNIAITKNL